MQSLFPVVPCFAERSAAVPGKRLRSGEDVTLLRSQRQPRHAAHHGFSKGPVDPSATKVRQDQRSNSHDAANKADNVCKMEPAQVGLKSESELHSLLFGRHLLPSLRPGDESSVLHLRRDMRRLLGVLASADSEHKVFWSPFGHLLLPEQAATYHEVTGGQPMDYSTLASRLATGWYDDEPQTFMQDVLNIHVFCAAYNGRESELGEAASRQLGVLQRAAAGPWLSMAAAGIPHYVCRHEAGVDSSRMGDSQVPHTDDHDDDDSQSRICAACAVRAIGIRSVLRVQVEIAAAMAGSTTPLGNHTGELLQGYAAGCDLNHVLQTLSDGAYDATGLVALLHDVQLFLWTMLASTRNPQKLEEDTLQSDEGLLWRRLSSLRQRWPQMLMDECMRGVLVGGLPQEAVEQELRRSFFIRAEGGKRGSASHDRTGEADGSADVTATLLAGAIHHVLAQPSAAPFMYLCLHDCIDEVRKIARSGSGGGAVDPAAASEKQSSLGTTTSNVLDLRAIELLISRSREEEKQLPGTSLALLTERCRFEMQRLASFTVQKYGPMKQESTAICELRNLFLSMTKGIAKA
jgi:hypothetical protein